MGVFIVPRRIIVCGIYRSGTSLLTRLVREWGAYAGKQDDLFEDEYGYLEHLALQKINDDLLNNNSRVPTPAGVLVEKLKDAKIVGRAKQVLADMDSEAREAEAGAWVWKDPRIPLVIPFWSHFWDDAIYIIPIRHPVETILSASKMEGLSPDETPLSAGLAYWQFCMLNILAATQSAPRKIFIAYDQLLQHPQRECGRLSEFLNSHCDLDDDSHIEAMTSLIESGKHHFHAPASLADLEPVTTEQRALYNFLRVKTIHPDESYRESDFALYPGWLEYLQSVDALVSIMSNAEEDQTVK